MTWIVLLLAAYGTVDISEVGGTQLMSVVNGGQQVSLLYMQKLTKFDIYLYDWKQPGATPHRFTQVSWDDRVRILGFAQLVDLGTGLGLVSPGTQRMYLLTKEGAYVEEIDFKPVLEDGERVQGAQSDGMDRLFLLSRLDGYDFVSRYSVTDRKRDVLFRAEQPGAMYFVASTKGFVQIRYNTGELWLFSDKFSEIHHVPGRFEAPPAPKNPLQFLRHRDVQLLTRPLIVTGPDGFLTMNYQAIQGKRRLSASARFDGKRFLFSRYRVLAFSPDHKTKMMYDYEEDTLILAPSDLSIKESAIPPTPDIGLQH